MQGTQGYTAQLHLLSEETAGIAGNHGFAKEGRGHDGCRNFLHPFCSSVPHLLGQESHRLKGHLLIKMRGLARQYWGGVGGRVAGHLQHAF